MTNPEMSENSDQSEAQGPDDLATLDLTTFITRKAELEGESEDVQVAAPERKTHDQIISELERKTHQVLSRFTYFTGTKVQILTLQQEKGRLRKEMLCLVGHVSGGAGGRVGGSQRASAGPRHSDGRRRCVVWADERIAPDMRQEMLEFQICRRQESHISRGIAQHVREPCGCGCGCGCGCVCG